MLPVVRALAQIDPSLRMGLATQRLGSLDASLVVNTCYLKPCWHPTRVIWSL